jgi:hypothetical protein
MMVIAKGLTNEERIKARGEVEKEFTYEKFYPFSTYLINLKNCEANTIINSAFFDKVLPVRNVPDEKTQEKYCKRYVEFIKYIYNSGRNQTMCFKTVHETVYRLIKINKDKYVLAKIAKHILSDVDLKELFEGGSLYGTLVHYATLY